MALNTESRPVLLQECLAGSPGSRTWGALPQEVELNSLDLFKTSWDFVPPVQEPVLPTFKNLLGLRPTGSRTGATPEMEIAPARKRERVRRTDERRALARYRGRGTNHLAQCFAHRPSTADAPLGE